MKRATILFFLFAALALTAIRLTHSIWLQNSALESVTAVAEVQLSQSEKTDIALGQIDNFDKYKQVSSRRLTGQRGILSSASELVGVVHANIRQLVVALSLVIAGMLVLGGVMFMQLRKQAKASAPRV